MEQAVYTVAEYCIAEKVSRTKVYDEWKRGVGVAFYRRGTKILISHEARVRHRERLEREAAAAKQVEAA
jgi:hypothetical protein